MVAVDRNRVLRTAGVALLLAVAVLFAPQRASADCGDYVTIVGETGQPVAQPGHDVGTPRKPCHGPDCAAGPCRPDLPLSAPVNTPPNPNEGVAAIPGALADPGDPDGYPVPTSCGRAIHRPESVFHPPPTA